MVDREGIYVSVYLCKVDVPHITLKPWNFSCICSISVFVAVLKIHTSCHPVIHPFLSSPTREISISILVIGNQGHFSFSSSSSHLDLHPYRNSPTPSSSSSGSTENINQLIDQPHTCLPTYLPTQARTHPNEHHNTTNQPEERTEHKKAGSSNQTRPDQNRSRTSTMPPPHCHSCTCTPASSLSSYHST